MQSERDEEEQQASKKPYFTWGKALTGIACGVATWFAAYYIGVVVCTVEGYREGTKYNGAVGGAYGALFGLLAGVCIVGPLMSSVGTLVGAWWGFTRGANAVNDLWRTAFNGLASIGNYVAQLPKQVPTVGGIWSKIAPFFVMATNAVMGRKIANAEMVADVDVHAPAKSGVRPVDPEPDMSDLFLSRDPSKRPKPKEQKSSAAPYNLDIDPETGASISSQREISRRDALARSHQKPAQSTRDMFGRFGDISDSAADHKQDSQAQPKEKPSKKAELAKPPKVSQKSLLAPKEASKDSGIKAAFRNIGRKMKGGGGGAAG